MMLRSRIACFVFTLLAPAALLAAADLPNFDAVAQAPVAERAPGRVAALQAVTPSPMRTEWHTRYGVPSFVWFGDGASDTVRTASSAARFTEPVETTARRYVWDNA